MMKNKITAAAWSASITMIVMVIVIIVSEYSAAFKGFLASLTGHHWVTKSILDVLLFVVLFVIFGLVMKKEKKESMKALIPAAIVGVASMAVIVAFYFIHYLGK